MSLRPPTRIDRFVGAWNPEKALKRVRARAALDAYTGLLTSGSGGYQGARTNKRSLKNWLPWAQSPDKDQVPDLPVLRGRSNDLIRNSPIGGGAINTVVTSTVGTGLNLTAMIDRNLLGLDDSEAQAWERDAERVWKLWCKQCDLTGEQHFSQIEDLSLRSQLGGGDVFILRRFDERPGDLLGLKVQLLEASRVSTPPEKEGDPRVIDGVEIDENGRASAYYVRNRYQYDLSHEPETWRRVETWGADSAQRQVLHLFDRLRPNQTRGVPYLAPVIEILKQLERYTESEIAAAVVASFFTVFLKSDDAEGFANQGTAPGEDDPPESAARDLKLASAAILELNPGESIETANPGRPNSAFDPFVTAVMTQIGIVLELPFEVLSKHFKASYSAARAALLEAWRFFRKRRAWLALDLCDPVYEWVIHEAVLRGQLTAPGFMSDPLLRQAWLGCTWTGPAQGQVNPVQEVKAVTDMHEAGWISDTEATQELRGRDFDAVTAQRQRDRQLRVAAGDSPRTERREEVEVEPPEDTEEGEDKS